MKEPKTTYASLSGDTDKLFSWRTGVFTLFGLLMNLLLANAVKMLGLPLYIDNVGSVLLGALAGPLPGMTVGFLSNVINSVGDPITMYYGILTIVMALLASVYAHRGYFKTIRGCLLIILSYILIGGGIGSIMTWLLYGGGIGGIGAPLANAVNLAGVSPFFSQLIADIMIDIPDKAITVLLAVLLIKGCMRFFPNAFPLSVLFDKNAAAASDSEVQTAVRSHSIKTLVLRLILVCSILISLAATGVSCFMYCKIEANINERLTYLIQMISVSFAVILIICAITIWIATKRIAEPVNQVVQQSRKFLEMPSEEWLLSQEWLERVPIKTGDEIEELYQAVCEEQETVAKNVMKMKETEEKLRHSKELEDALENARQASKAKGQFLSKMSHEIRTPLNAVIGYMDIAKTSADQPEKMMHCIENSELAAKHLLNIINDVLDISSIENGKMKIAHEEFNLKEQLTTVSTLFYNQAKEKDIHFETVIQELSEEWVVGDSLRLNQILMNLLSNAVKFTDAGGTVALHISQLNQSGENIYLKCEVSDTGIGMNEEFMGRLFQPFEQESATTAQKYGGTGLGLSITANLVSMMGGAISVKSKPNVGTTFTATVPLAISADAHIHPGLENYGKLRALIIDENETDCTYLKKLLKRCGIKSDAVSGEIEAVVRQIEKRNNSDYSYDFCIIDWNMSHVAYEELIREIQQKSAQKLAIIAMAYDMTEVEEEAKQAGADKLVSKPLFQSSIFDFLVSTYGKYEAKPENPGMQMNLSGMRILLAEDNAMNLEIAVDILEKAGMTVDTAENGELAAEMFAMNAAQYAAILMDVQMPVMDGYAATKLIRSMPFKEAATIPIIAMTANAFHEDVAEALSCGMNEHISKPIDYDKLFRVLQKVSDQIKVQ